MYLRLVFFFNLLILYYIKNYNCSNVLYITYPGVHIGKNKLASLAPIIAQICQFENPQAHKAHGKRSFGITLLSNSSATEETKLRVSRHTGMKSHTRNQRLTGKNIEKKYKAMNPLLCRNDPVDETQIVVICNSSKSPHTESFMQTNNPCFNTKLLNP